MAIYDASGWMQSPTGGWIPPTSTKYVAPSAGATTVPLYTQETAPAGSGLVGLPNTSGLTSGGTTQTAAQKAAELGMTDLFSQANQWTDPKAYQNFMTGTQALGTGTKVPDTTGPTTVMDAQGKSWLSHNGQWYDPAYYEIKNGQVVQKTVAPLPVGGVGGVSGVSGVGGVGGTGYSGVQDPQITAILQQMQNIISNQPTVESIVNSPAFQQMQQAIMGQMDQSMKGARADLAARGVLGEGSTPAVERMGQVAGYYGQQLGNLVPSMMNTASNMHGNQASSLQGLVNLLTGLDQQDWQRGQTEFLNVAPYTRLTAGQKAELANTLIMNVPALRGYSPEQVMEWLDSSGMGV